MFWHFLRGQYLQNSTTHTLVKGEVYLKCWGALSLNREKKLLTLVQGEKQFAEAEISTGQTSLQTLNPQILC